MSKLDDIVDNRYGIGAQVPANPEKLRLQYHVASKQQIKDLMLEIIGADIQKIRETEGSPVAKYYVNKKLAEIRKRIEKL